VVIIVRMLDLQLFIPYVPITTVVVSSNPAHGKAYSIQYYVTDRRDMTEKVLKVALSTVNQTI